MDVPSSIVVHQPAGPAQSLILLLHGVGSNAHNMVPVGQAFAAQFPHALVLSLEGLQASDFGQGRQWFSVAGVTDANRPGRVAAVMPAFRTLIEQLQTASGVSAENTTLVGFSQGSIMALECTQTHPALAAQVVAFSGRFASPPTHAAPGLSVHLIHGDADPVMPVQNSRHAAMQLQALGVAATLHTEPGMGHGINESMLSKALALG